MNVATPSRKDHLLFKVIERFVSALEMQGKDSEKVVKQEEKFLNSFFTKKTPSSLV